MPQLASIERVQASAMLTAVHPHAIATRSQLLAAGIPNSTITRRYERVLPGIYSADQPTTFARCYAVTLWQPNALLSHRTAAWLYGWMDEHSMIEATLPAASKARTPFWLRMYRRDLPASDTTEVVQLPVVARERTLIDCIAVMTPEAVARIVDERLATDIDAQVIASKIRSTPRRRGNSRASSQLRSAASGFASEPERVLDRALIACGLRIATNHWVGNYVCDFVDELARVVVEVDGREFHSAPEVFSKDRRRQNDLVLDGWLVLRFSAFDVMANPEKTARQIAGVVRRRRRARN
ncbi:DUF559 domain-containing protein [Rhodococcus sp. 1168]|uniref:DUF559 domain-containing protein n=1 Tax=Rhodococcus sp. 1168 TaxID=2018041 RepID=UPI0020CB3842|nr:DUF559 domain-containing protein [Rhodococcus sp. 1168]